MINIIIGLLLAFLFPPLSVFVTLLYQNNNPNWVHFWINLALTTTAPPFGCIHAIWFILNERSRQSSNTQQLSQPSTIPIGLSVTKFLQKTHLSVSIVQNIVSIFMITIGVIISFFGLLLGFLNVYIASQNLKHSTPPNLPAEPYQENEKSR
ncbi:MAG: YqaE/Pmp3 family membrane protein [Nostoc sp.]|uniref:YqaE/Pmp3 family membrane protein n=1 Tax=Nostoc sp. TaxID=1180 RepID=UPI002FF7A66E